MSSGDFGLILSDGSPDLLLNPDCWPGLQASLMSSDERPGLDQVRVKVWRSALDVGLIPVLLQKQDARWFLDKAFVDLNTPKVMAFLAFLATES
jgi:hypothetical protein